MLVYKNPHLDAYNAAQSELSHLMQERQTLNERLQWIEQRANQLSAYLAATQVLIAEEPGQELMSAGLSKTVPRDLGSKQSPSDRYASPYGPCRNGHRLELYQRARCARHYVATGCDDHGAKRGG